MFAVMNKRVDDEEVEAEEDSSDEEFDSTYDSKGRPKPKPKPEKVAKSCGKWQKRCFNYLND